MSRDRRRRRGRSAARDSSSRAREIGRTIAVGMVFTLLLLVVAHILFEHSFLARQIELLTYNLVQHRLSLRETRTCQESSLRVEPARTSMLYAGIASVSGLPTFRVPAEVAGDYASSTRSPRPNHDPGH